MIFFLVVYGPGDEFFDLLDAVKEGSLQLKQVDHVGAAGRVLPELILLMFKVRGDHLDAAGNAFDRLGISGDLGGKFIIIHVPDGIQSFVEAGEVWLVDVKAVSRTGESSTAFTVRVGAVT